jgi:DNA-binding HxlR family transcriptional regulator
LQVIRIILFGMAKVLTMERRSGCPVSVSLERFGDRWSLLIIRDLMVRGYTTFKEFKESGEGIATNILASRLRMLQTNGLVETERDGEDARRLRYRLTEKGIGLAPVMLELLLWASRYEETAAPCAVMEGMAAHREHVLAEVRRRWKDRDPVAFLPPFKEAAGGKEKQIRPHRGRMTVSGEEKR